MKGYKQANSSLIKKISVLSITCGCAFSVNATPYTSPIEVDGTVLSISDADTVEISNSSTQLVVKNSGSLTLTNVADAKLSSNGSNAANISMSGAGSQLTITDSHLTTSGVESNYAVVATDGAELGIYSTTMDNSGSTSSGLLSINAGDLSLAPVTITIEDSAFNVGQVGLDLSGRFTANMNNSTVTSDMFGRLISIGKGEFTGAGITLTNTFAGTSTKNSEDALITSAGMDQIANVYASHLESMGVQLIRAAGSSEFTFGSTSMSWTKGAGVDTNDTAVAAWAWDRTGSSMLAPVHDTTRLSFTGGTWLLADGNGSEAYGVSVNHLTTFSMEGARIELTNTGSEGGAAITMAGAAEVTVTDNSFISASGKNSHAIYLSDEQDIASSLAYPNAVLAGAGNKKVTVSDSQLVAESSAISSQANDNSLGYSREVALDGSEVSGKRAVSESITDWSGEDDEIAIEHKGIGAGIANKTLSITSINGTSISGGLLVSGRSGRLDYDSNMSELMGSVYADSGVANVNFDSGFWTGSAYLVNQGSIDAKLQNGSHWGVTKSSDVTSLYVDDSSEVDLGNSENLSASNKVRLTTNSLQGDGFFVMRTDMAHYTGSKSTPYGDLLVINDQSSGSHTLTFNDSASGSSLVNGYERLMVVQYRGGSPLNNQASFTGNNVDVGPYIYELNQAKDGNWYLGRGAPPKLSNPANVSANLLNIGYMLNHVENDTLLQRMGELRSNANSSGDFWIRSFAGKTNKFNQSNLSSLHLNYAGMQLGVDRKIALANGDDLYVGLMAGYTKGDTDYKVGGGGDTKSYHGGFYATYKTKDDWYVDGIIKYVHMKNDVNTYTSSGAAVDGNSASKGFSVGLEGGKRFYVGSEALTKEGWYLEPQSQVTYSYQSASTVRSSNGLKTTLGNYDSILVRGSLIAGYGVIEGNNPVDVYVKGGYLREFNGNSRFTFNDYNKEHYTFRGGWWDSGVGVNMQLRKSHNIYLDGTFAKGNKFDRRQINLGYRYSF